MRPRLRRPLALAALAGLAAAPVAATLAAPAGSTALVSRPAGFGALAVPVTNDSAVSAESALGVDERSARVVSGDPANRYVAFVSDADGLSADDVDTVQNVYVRDRLTGLTTLVSRADGAAGPGANGRSGLPAMSGDGRYVAFASSATNLTATSVSGAVSHVYLRDLVAGTTTLADRADGQDGGVASTGATDPSVAVAGGGPVVAFASDAPNLPGANGSGQVYVRRFGAWTTTLVSAHDGTALTPGTGDSGRPSISADATAVAFASDADDLAAPGGGAAVRDVFLRTLATDGTELVSGTGATEGDGDSGAPSVSADGSRVAFSTASTNLGGAADDNGAGDVYVKVAGGATIFLVSRASGAGAVGGGDSGEPSINAAGTQVAFASDAADLVAGDGNGLRDVFLRTAVGGVNPVTTRVSAPAGAEADGASASPSIAPDAAPGTAGIVVFDTRARDMGPLDDDDFRQVYARAIGTVVGVPVPEHLSRPSGAEVFRSGVNAAFLRSPGRAAEAVDAMSADGRYTVFLSPADELSADDDDRFVNVFRRDNLTGETVLVSRADGPAGAAADGPSGTEGGAPPLVTQPAGAPAVSDDGNRIAFVSAASNLVPGDANPGPDVFVRDVAAGTTTLVSRGPDGSALSLAAGDPAISGDGRRVAFVTSQPLAPGDANGLDADVYVRDLSAGTTTLASRTGADGPAGDDASREPALDADGTHVAFVSDATDLAPGDANGASDVFVRDLAAATTTLASRADGAGGAIGSRGGFAPSLSAAGTRVAFASTSPDLVPAGDVNGLVQDVFVRDTAAGTTTLASRTAGASGVSGNGASGRPSLSADGTRVAFESAASDLVPGDANGLQDVLLRDLAQGTTEVVSRAAGAAGAQGDAASGDPALSAGGGCVAFGTGADNLVVGMPPGRDFGRVVARGVRGECPFGPVPADAPATPAPPLPPPAAGPGPADRDAFGPVLGKPRITPARFRAGVRVQAARRGRPATGGVLRFSLSEAARVSVGVGAVLPGVRFRGRCVAPRRALRGTRCTRLVRKGVIVVQARPGETRVNVTGRLRGRLLAPGRYRLTVVATDGAGNPSAARTATFTILPPARRRARPAGSRTSANL